MTQVFEAGQRVYLPDGREAEYVLANGQDHLVRIIHEVEGNGYDEQPYSYPSDKITTTREAYANAPVEIWDKQVLAKRMEISALDREIGLKRKEIADAGKAKIEMEKAATKYPCIQQALDFIEGRITHVVVHGYGGAEIKTLKEAFEQEDIWGGRRKFEGMKLLNLFGTDESGRNVAWGLNQYRDGSGSLKYQIDPARSEGDAMQIVKKLLIEAVETWREGGRPETDIQGTLDKNPWLTPPDDWIAHIEAKKAEQRAAKIEKLRAELVELEKKGKVK
jgi:hypothetical protein